jgi:hypothetical protein
MCWMIYSSKSIFIERLQDELFGIVLSKTFVNNFQQGKYLWEMNLIRIKSIRLLLLLCDNNSTCRRYWTDFTQSRLRIRPPEKRKSYWYFTCKDSPSGPRCEHISWYLHGEKRGDSGTRVIVTSRKVFHVYLCLAFVSSRNNRTTNNQRKRWCIDLHMICSSCVYSWCPNCNNSIQIEMIVYDALLCTAYFKFVKYKMQYIVRRVGGNLGNYKVFVIVRYY